MAGRVPREEILARHRLLFVCLGNICRSPMAEGVFADMAAQAGRRGDFLLDSSGTGDWHIGNPPDGRAQAAALSRGVDISGLRARQTGARDFHDFDLILAMDRANVADLEFLAPPGARAQVRLFMEFAPETGVGEVPDPYFGAAGGFEEALDLIEAASRGLLKHLDRTP
jgi:protein-tyrosine phosphatase